MALRDLSAALEDDGLDYPFQAVSFEDGKLPDSRPHFADNAECGKRGCPMLDVHVHYAVPSPSAKVGLWLTGLTSLGMSVAAGTPVDDEQFAKLKLDDDQEKSFYQRVLGPVYDDMIGDQIKWTVLQKVGQDALLCFAMSQETADAALAGLGKPPARPNRAIRRTQKKTAGGKSRRASGDSANPKAKPDSHASLTSPTVSEEPKAV